MVGEILLPQNIIVTGMNDFDTFYFDTLLQIRFAAPHDWTVSNIKTYDNVHPNGIGLRPPYWRTSKSDSVDFADDAVVTYEYAITLSFEDGSIVSLCGPDIDSSKLDTTQAWIYYRYDLDVPIYRARSGRSGIETAYGAVLDNRKGKCVRIETDPMYDEITSIYYIKNSIRF